MSERALRARRRARKRPGARALHRVRRTPIFPCAHRNRQISRHKTFHIQSNISTALNPALNSQARAHTRQRRPVVGRNKNSHKLSPPSSPSSPANRPVLAPLPSNRLRGCSCPARAPSLPAACTRAARGRRGALCQVTSSMRRFSREGRASPPAAAAAGARCCGCGRARRWATTPRGNHPAGRLRW